MTDIESATDQWLQTTYEAIGKVIAKRENDKRKEEMIANERIAEIKRQAADVKKAESERLKLEAEKERAALRQRVTALFHKQIVSMDDEHLWVCYAMTGYTQRETDRAACIQAIVQNVQSHSTVEWLREFEQLLLQ